MKLCNLLRTSSCAIPLLAAIAAMLMSGCSSGNANSASPAPAAKTQQGKGAGVEEVAESETAVSRSVFTIDQNSRDPFFPKARRAVATIEAPKQAEAPLDVLGILQEGFEAVLGSGKNRIALINNIMLEEGRQTVIPIRAGGQSRSVAVRCREVTRDSVVLEVQGYAQPVRLILAGL